MLGNQIGKVPRGRGRRRAGDAGLIAYCRENSRVCPMPQRWNALWELLPNRKRVGGGWEPPLPLILAAAQIVRSATGQLDVTGRMLLDRLSYTHLELQVAIEDPTGVFR